MFLRDAAIGTLIRIPESGGDALYKLASKNTHKVGCVTLVRVTPTKFDIFGQTEIYENSDVDAYLSGEFMDTLPAALRARMETVELELVVDATGTKKTIPRKCFLLSRTEVNLGMTHGGAVEGMVQPVYTDDASRIVSDMQGTPVTWWLRSFTSIKAARTVLPTGAMSYAHVSQNVYDIVPAIVLPGIMRMEDAPGGDGGHPLVLSEDIDAVVPFGAYDVRPRAVAVAPRYRGKLISLQATNNYGDAAPAWEDIEHGATHAFENAVCASGMWAVAVRVQVDRDGDTQANVDEFSAAVGV